MMMRDPRELGIGVVYSPRLARVLDLDLVDVLEVEPQMFWRATGDPDDPIAIDDAQFSTLRTLPQHKLVHSVTLPVGNSQPHDPRALACLRRNIDVLDAPYVSEHLSFNAFDHGSERLWAGFFLPPLQDRQAVAIAATRIDEMRGAVGVPVAFETGVNYLRPRPDELSDGAFIREVAEAADCGILLDLHNLLTNERNGRASVRAVFAEIPADRVWEIHLGGGMPYRGYWLDSHSSHIDDALHTVTREIVDACPNLRAIIFEIMDQYVGEPAREALQGDVRRMRKLWTERGRPTRISLRALPERQTEAPDPGTALRRANTLGALAVGRAPRDPDPALTDDPAVALYADLVASMREGVLYEALPFLVRLLLLSIGPPATMQLITAFHAALPPEQFGADEARHFLVYVRQQALDVRYLNEVLAFAEALLALDGTCETRRVRFTCDPLALLQALQERRPPGDLPSQDVEVEVGADGLLRLAGDAIADVA
jgi:uncharacterized protein